MPDGVDPGVDPVEVPPGDPPADGIVIDPDCDELPAPDDPMLRAAILASLTSGCALKISRSERDFSSTPPGWRRGCDVGARCVT
jgi:hypothetical protein